MSTQQFRIFDDPDLLGRATRAHFRACDRLGAVAAQPSTGSYCLEQGGGVFVVLVNHNGILAVYEWDAKTDRLRFDERLSRAEDEEELGQLLRRQSA